MSHRFPRFRIHNSEAVDVDDFNRALLPFAEEATGKINEHNVASQATAGSPIQRTDVNQNAGYRWRHAQHINDGMTSTTGTPFEIVRGPYWRTVTGATLTWVGPAARFWILASWQLHPLNVSTPLGNGPMFAIRVNGTVIDESIVGSVEFANDPLGGLLWGAWPHAVDTLVSLPEGQNTIELVVRTLQTSSGIRDVVWNRELIILQQTR